MSTKLTLPMTLFVLLATAFAREPPTLLVDKGACPGEGCSYGEWKVAKTTSVRTRPDINAPVIGELEVGTTVNALTGEVHVVPRQFVVSKPHRRYKKGDVLWVYSYVGEGYFKVRFGGESYNDDLGFSPYGGSSGTRCEAAAECWGELKGQYQQAWWVEIETPGGLTGWSDANDFTRDSTY